LKPSCLLLNQLADIGGWATNNGTYTGRGKSGVRKLVKLSQKSRYHREAFPPQEEMDPTSKILTNPKRGIF
jgi:hypothetical protein